MKIPFVGGSYALRVRKADVQRVVNMFPSVVASGTGKAPAILQSIPGYSLFTTLGGAVRGFCIAQGRVFAVGGPTLYEVSSGGTLTSRGTLASSSGVVSVDKNRNQVIAVDGSNGYVLDLSTNTFTQISDVAFYGSNIVQVTDGIAVFTRPDTDTFYLSAVDNALSFDALEFAVAESDPSPIVGHIVDHAQIFLFSEIGGEVWDNTGGVDFTFSRNPGAKIQTGCSAKHSLKQLDNTIYWVGGDERGSGAVWKLSGYTPQRVSTQPIEEVLQTSTDLSSCRAYCYQQDGHSFYCLQVPGLDTTWVYDAATGEWHERAEFNASGEFEQHTGVCHIYAFGKHLIGSDDGNIYEYDTSLNANNSEILCRERTSPHFATPELQRVFLNSFQVDCNVGDGKPSGQAALMMLRYSKNGGKTWGSWNYVSLGVVGQWTIPARILRLGTARDWVFQVRCTDNVPFNIVGAVTK